MPTDCNTKSNTGATIRNAKPNTDSADSSSVDDTDSNTKSNTCIANHHINYINYINYNVHNNGNIYVVGVGITGNE
jgi:hypothetical protein